MTGGMGSEVGLARDDEESNAELVLFQVKECYVYMVWRSLWIVVAIDSGVKLNCLRWVVVLRAAWSGLPWGYLSWLGLRCL